MITSTGFAAVFFGMPDQVGRVRGELRDYLAGCPVVEEVLLVASELAANAVTHSASRGCVFTVRCETFRDYAWVEVEDLGGPWLIRQQDTRPHGLDVVTALAESWSVEATSDGMRIVSARVGFRA